MGNIASFENKAEANVDRARGLETPIHVGGVFHVQHIRDGKVIAEFDAPNMATTEGLNYLLNAGFDGSPAAITTWYCGLIDDTVGGPTLAQGDTLASHTGWNESLYTAYYSESVRLTWNPTASTVRSLANASAMVFSINNSRNIWGILICSVSTGTSGTLWATAAFAAKVTVTNGDSLRVTYTLSAA